ncbi:ABC transporter substrate-binding protein [Coleofasciculus sp. FACHB-SPT9]|uniref:ABC transporter substrate-binding protein n=1 Tax=Cyanophyceae TaxID=3028117 RepID=UPI00168236C8|nr:ABC transporter substrate-binding protein [Coleofasciculus sp. FACHB-SPT9]MBD1891683.1 ABC transporter substrate-binding protein [Coleofasciculus sp. FACHB-SPT9]
MHIKLLSLKSVLFSLLVVSLTFTSACSNTSANTSANTSGSSSGKKVIRIAIGTQDQTINTVTGGAVIREEKLLEKYLPKTGKYQNVEYKIEWSSATSAPPITNKMLANQIDIGNMADFPATINLTTFQKKGNGVKTVLISSLAYSPNGAGNAVVVPTDTPYKKLADLKGKTISVPFGTSAHGMLLRALKNEGIDAQKEVTLVSQSPEVGGTSLRSRQIDAHADFVPYGELFPFRGFARKIYDGAQTETPTFHGVVVRSDFAKENPEIVVAYLKAMLEANQRFREQPEALSAKLEKWTGIEKEIFYMFLGPSGIQKLDPRIQPYQITALKNSVTTLKQIGKLDASVNPDDVASWTDDSYLKQALKESNISEQDVATSADNLIRGNDALTQESIPDPKLAAQIWVEGEDKVLSFTSIKNMLTKLQQLKSEGKTAAVAFVHDRDKGWKLFAQNSFYVRNGDQVSAFLLEKDAQAFAGKAGAKVASFQELQQLYAKNTQSKDLAVAR